MEAETAVVNERYEVALNRVRVTTLTEDLPASDLLLDREVVFRALKPALTEDRTFVDRFRKQVQLAANLTHPNIVSVFDWGREKDGFANRPGPVYFVITERNAGRSVWSYVNDKGPLPIERCVHILLGVTSALGYAHRSGALHAGLRPELISVSPNGLVKVSDFGFLEAVGSPASLPDASVSDVQWLAPELAAGETPDQRTDVYGLGQLCYFLVTARIPFQGTTVAEVLRKQQSGIPAAPRKIRPELPRALEVIIGRCLAKRPGDRFANVNEVRNALIRLQDTLGGKQVTGSASAEPGIERSEEAIRAATESARSAIADGGEPVGPDEPTRIHIPPIRRPTPTQAPHPSTADASEISGTVGKALTESPERANPENELISPAKAVTPATIAASPSATPAAKNGEQRSRPLATSSVRPPTFAAEVESETVPSVRPRPPRQPANASDDDATQLATADRRRPASNDRPSDGFEGDATMVAPIRRKPSIRAWMMLLGMAVVLAGLLALLAQSLKDSRVEVVVVPNVISQSREAATAELVGIGLRVETQYEKNVQVARDVVFGQTPLPNGEVQAGSLVTLTVSSGDGILRVPDVVGQSETVATANLRNFGFDVKVEPRADANTAPGNVIEQNPAGDTEAQSGTEVKIIVAARTGTAKVPDLTGKTSTEAGTLLVAEGFRMVLRDEASSTTEKGLVSRTEPTAGQEIDRNSPVIVFVSRGPAIDVPSVYGQTEAAAIETLKTLGFNVDRQTRVVAKTSDIGVVIDQTPKGSAAVVGSTVSIVVGIADPATPTSVPAAEGGSINVVTTTTLPPPSTAAPAVTVPEVVTVPAPEVTSAPTAPPTQPPTVPPTAAPEPTTPAPVTPAPVPVATAVPA
jgi:eukaryotic-like serine/threonine-protein kinase